MPSSTVLDATLLNSPHDLRWPRCARCTSTPYALCSRCESGYGTGVTDAVCDACAASNVELAGHRQRHSELLALCVDAEVFDLVEELFVAGARTVGSCAGSAPVALGRPYVGFATVSDVEPVLAAALEAATLDGCSHLEARVNGLPTVTIHDRWVVTMVIDRSTAPFVLRPHLDLPPRDVAWLTSVLRSARTK